MESEGKGMLGKIILGAVLIILGAVIISVVAEQALTKTDTRGVAAESHALTTPAVGNINTTAMYTVNYPPTGWKVADCPITSFVIKNQSGGNQLTLTTDYTFNSNNGTYYLKNTTATVQYIGAFNKTYVDYKYCADDYLNSSWGRTVLNMVAGFIAIMLLVAAAAVFYSIYKDVR